MVKKILLIPAVLAFMGLSAQQKHTVVKGDNPYNIAKKYGMSLDELLRMNPSAKNGSLNIGDVVTVKGKPAAAKVPVKQDAAPKSQALGKIILAPKQTVYGITRQYHITESDLRKLNPALDANMKIGSEITLPLENIRKYGNGQETAPATSANTAATVVTSGDNYTVQPKDNYYKITKSFGLTQSQLFALNPGLEAKGLHPGDVLRVRGNVPASENFNQTSSSASDNFITYEVKDGDTVFGILNRFEISLDQLLELNPQLSGGLKAGMTLKIKKTDAVYEKKDNGALSVALMLPFGFDSNDSKYRSMALDFLAGAKLAIERNTRTGQRLDIKVIDAGSEASFKNTLAQINKDNTDLIIGPFLKSNVVQTLDYVGSKKIPVVAPFANTPDLYKYDNLVIMETADDVYIDKIAKEIAQIYADQKIYILSGSNRDNANAIKSALEKSLKTPSVVIVNSAQDIVPEKNMMTGQDAPIVAVLASSDEALGSGFSSLIAELSKDVAGNRAFSMYYHPSFEKRVDELRPANLVYLMDRTINPDGSFEKEILADYKRKYCKTPSKYAVVGFDVVNDMLTRENRKGELFKQMNKSQTQLATKFEYVRAKNNGAYLNTGYRVVRLVP